jgi:zinc transport system ATP-binding protein
MNAISIDHVDFFYGQNKILENLNAVIKPGTLMGVVGPNGGGKTTFLNLIMGFLKPHKGSIKIFGKDPKEALELIGYVPQISNFDRLFPITVQEVVMMGILNKRSSFGRLDPLWLEKSDQILDQLGLLCKKNEIFFDLSGGQAQRVLIARALLKSPKILILDEPTSNIDRENEKILFDLLKSLKSQTTILMVSHSLKTLTQEVDGALLINKSMCYLKPEELCQHYSLGIFHPPLQIKRP